MIGTNDANQGFDDPGAKGQKGYGGETGFAADATARLETLISRLYADNPGLTLVLASLTPFADPAKEARVMAYNAFVPRLITAHQKSGQNVLFADMHAALSAADLSADGIHPELVAMTRWRVSGTPH